MAGLMRSYDKRGCAASQAQTIWQQEDMVFILRQTINLYLPLSPFVRMSQAARKRRS